MYAVSQAVPLGDLIQVAFDSLRDHVCVIDRHGSIVATNEAWDGFARRNGANLSRCGPGIDYLRVCRASRGPFSEHALAAAEGIESVLRGAAPQFNLDYPCPPSPSRKVWFRLIARPLRRPYTGAVILHTDITNQVLLAEKFRRTEAQCSALWENPVDAGTLLAPDGTIRFQSPASEGVLGRLPEELAGRVIFDFIHPDDLDALREALHDCLHNPAAKHPCEYRFRNKDGSWRTVEGFARKFLSQPEGGIILNLRDVTYRKLAEEALLAKQTALQHKRDELEALAARLFREREEERRRLALELNGNLRQRLASMSVQAAYLAAHAVDAGQSSDFQDRVEGLGHDIQHLSGDLYPALLDHFGLAVALREFCAQFGAKQGIPVRYFHRGLSAGLPPPISLALFRIAEESLSNVVKHAAANQAAVLLNRAGKGVRLTIRDDGRGFDPAAIAPGAGLGILSMRQRMRVVKGALTIQSRPRHGTEVVAVAPIG